MRTRLRDRIRRMVWKAIASMLGQSTDVYVTIGGWKVVDSVPNLRGQQKEWKWNAVIPAANIANNDFSDYVSPVVIEYAYLNDDVSLSYAIFIHSIRYSTPDFTNVG